MEGVVGGNVVAITKPRAPRVTKTEKAARLAAEKEAEDDPDLLPM
jgi:hypothetical protein